MESGYFDRNKLNALLKWYMQEVGNDLLAALVVNREGLMIDSITKSSEGDEKFIGAFGALVELVLKKITTDFELGKFGAGAFDTDKYRFIFCEAGPEFVFITVLMYEASVDPYFPYAYLAAEKISRIFDGRPVSPVIPKLKSMDKKEQIFRKQEILQKITVEGKLYIHKLILGGEEGVGKTSLVLRFVDNIFYGDYKPTIGTSIMKKECKFKGLETSVRFVIWDLGGQPQFKRVRKEYISMAEAGIIVFDVTNRKSFDEVKAWHEEILVQADEDLRLVLVGNKIDLEAERVVSRQEGLELANKLGVPYVETSAKTGENVNEAFRVLALHLVQRFLKTSELPWQK